MKWSKKQKTKQECPTEWDPTKTVYATQATEPKTVEEINEAIEKAIPTKSEVQKAFKVLSDELLIAGASEHISIGQCAVYLAYSTLVDGLYESLKESLRCMED